MGAGLFQIHTWDGDRTDRQVFWDCSSAYTYPSFSSVISTSPFGRFGLDRFGDIWDTALFPPTCIFAFLLTST